MTRTGKIPSSKTANLCSKAPTIGRYKTMKKIRHTVYLLLGLLSCLTAHSKDINDEYAVFGLGGKSCQGFLVAHNLGGKQYDNYESWLLGFFSAYNETMPNTYNILGARRLDQIINWLISYCQDAPNEFFVTAAVTLINRLYPSRQNLSPNRRNIIRNFQ